MTGERTRLRRRRVQGLVLRDGLVVASHGRHYLVETPEGDAVLICHPRGKKSQAVVGDRVRWQASEDEGTIEQVNERKNLFNRHDEICSKSFAANPRSGADPHRGRARVLGTPAGAR